MGAKYNLSNCLFIESLNSALVEYAWCTSRVDKVYTIKVLEVYVIELSHQWNYYSVAEILTQHYPFLAFNIPYWLLTSNVSYSLYRRIPSINTVELNDKDSKKYFFGWKAVNSYSKFIIGTMKEYFSPHHTKHPFWTNR